MPEDTGILRLSWIADVVSIDVVHNFVRSVERAYNQAWLFERSSVEDIQSRFAAGRFVEYEPDRPYRLPETRKRQSPLGGSALGRWAIPPSERLALQAVVIQSPGFWDVVGQLNPFETIRKYLQERHIRRQDRAYREAAEEERLRLENIELELRNEEQSLKNYGLQTQAMRDRLELLRDSGLSDEAIEQAFLEMVARPLIGLARFQERGVIGRPQLNPTESDSKATNGG